MSKSKAVTSRDAGDKDLEQAKKEFEGKDEESKAEGRTPPAQGETIVEKVAPKKKRKSAPKSMKDSVPKVEKKKKRSDREYKIQKQAHGNVMDQGIELGDTGAIPPVKDWRVVSDHRLMLNGRTITMKAGQIVTRLTHDLDSLKRQGVVLEAVR